MEIESYTVLSLLLVYCCAPQSIRTGYGKCAEHCAWDGRGCSGERSIPNGRLRAPAFARVPANNIRTRNGNGGDSPQCGVCHFHLVLFIRPRHLSGYTTDECHVVKAWRLFNSQSRERLLKK